MGEYEEEQSFYTEDNYGHVQLKSKRLPDMHGATDNPTPSATPDQRLESWGVEYPKSEALLHKISRQNQQYLHGEREPKASLPVLVNLLNTNIEILKTLKNIQDLMEFQVPIGQEHGFNFTFPATGGFVHIDFVDPTQTYGLPSGVVVNEPGRKLHRLKLLNDSSGGPPAPIVKWSSNIPRSDKSTEMTLNGGEMDDSLHFDYNIIWSVNIASTAAAAIRCFYVV